MAVKVYKTNTKLSDHFYSDEFMGIGVENMILK